jgi:hypothetical protein
MQDIKKCNLQCAHTQAHQNTPQKKQGREFQILITCFNADDPTA